MLLGNEGINVITVKKDALLTVLKENMTKHREVFLDAQEGYRADAIKAIEAMRSELASAPKP